MIYILIAFIVLYSIILHELAHAKVAEIMGDPTARMYGRMTLNPLSHLDPIGTLLPILLIMAGAPIVFGWAKPVPINPYNFTDYKKGTLFVSAAGIVTNLFVAWVLATIVRFVPLNNLLHEALIYGIQINIVLAVFNLIPIPPLDGSKILTMLLPTEYAQYIYQLEPYGFIILVLVLIFPPTQYLLWTVIDLVFRLMMGGLF